MYIYFYIRCKAKEAKGRDHLTYTNLVVQTKQYILRNLGFSCKIFGCIGAKKKWQGGGGDKKEDYMEGIQI